MSAQLSILRPGALDGVTVQADRGSVADNACSAAGAELVDEGGHVLVVDAEAIFASGGDEALRAGLDGAWERIHAWFAADNPGKIVILGPRPDAGARARALRAGLENLARTLSIEWSRYGIRIVTILPGEESTDDEVAQIVAYLASEAGDYFSGTALTLT